LLIIFDLDDTLIDTSTNITPFVLERTLKQMINKGLEIEDENLAYKKLIQINKKSFSSKETIKKFLCEIKANMSFLDVAFNAMVEPLDENIKIFTLQNAKKVLKHLSKNHTLAIVSAGNKKFQFDKIKKAGIDTALFSKIVIAKSDKGFHYKKIIDELGFRAKNTLVCGDRVNIDLLPAKKIGCKTIHMKWGRGKLFLKDENVDFTINQLDEIKTILDQKLR